VSAEDKRENFEARDEANESKRRKEKTIYQDYVMNPAQIERVPSLTY
jgi:hypothetical protein